MIKKYLTIKWLMRIAIFLILLVGILALTGTLHLGHPARVLTPDQTQETQLNKDNKKEFVEKQGSTGSNTANNQAQAADGSNIDISARQETNNSVTVFTKLYGFSSGNCQLTVTNGVNHQSLSAGIIYQSQFSTCAGFSVPISGLGTGDWNIRLSVNSNGTLHDKSITFGVK
jgi:hypothetical protein